MLFALDDLPVFVTQPRLLQALHGTYSNIMQATSTGFESREDLHQQSS